MITDTTSLKPTPAGFNHKGQLPDLRLVTGEQGRVYGKSMIENKIMLTPATPGNFNGVMPEFGRARDVQYISGIKRGLLHLLVAEGKIKSVLIRRQGNVHGTRYYSMQSVISYLNSLMEEQAHEKTKNLSGPAGSGSDCGQNQSSGTTNGSAQQASTNNN